jgi:adenylate kinase
MKIVVCISGTPGTGKTEVSKELCRILDANYIPVNLLIMNGMIEYSWDYKRRTMIIDVKRAESAARKCLKSGYNVIDSHYSHLMRCDFCVILRTNPVVLKKRLEKRGWPERKVNENVMAEILDEITQEALEKRQKIIEIDTTKRNSRSTALAIKRALNNYPMQKKFIDWTRKYSKLLAKMGAENGSRKA